MCDKIPSKELFMLKNYHDRYKTQEIYDKAVDSYLPTLKFVSDWFVTSKMVQKLDNAVFSNDNLVIGDIDSDIITFFSNYINLNSINLSNINLDDNNFDGYDLVTINQIRLMAWCDKYKQH